MDPTANETDTQIFALVILAGVVLFWGATETVFLYALVQALFLAVVFGVPMLVMWYRDQSSST